MNEFGLWNAEAAKPTGRCVLYKFCVDEAGPIVPSHVILISSVLNNSQAWKQFQTQEARVSPPQYPASST